MKICTNCSGAVLKPDKTYGYTGPICYCSGNQRQLQVHSLNSSVPTYITEIISRLEKIEHLVLGFKGPKEDPK